MKSGFPGVSLQITLRGVITKPSQLLQITCTSRTSCSTTRYFDTRNEGRSYIRFDPERYISPDLQIGMTSLSRSQEWYVAPYLILQYVTRPERSPFVNQ